MFQSMDPNLTINLCRISAIFFSLFAFLHSQRWNFWLQISTYDIVIMVVNVPEMWYGRMEIVLDDYMLSHCKELRADYNLYSLVFLNLFWFLWRTVRNLEECFWRIANFVAFLSGVSEI